MKIEIDQDLVDKISSTIKSNDDEKIHEWIIERIKSGLLFGGVVDFFKDAKNIDPSDVFGKKITPRDDNY